MNYCKLYVDSEEDVDTLQDVVDAMATRFFRNMDVDTAVFANENYTGASDPRAQFYIIERSRFYLEVDSDADDERLMGEFQAGTVQLVRALREGGRFVVASCDFEDLVASETGWNWTSETPFHPE